MIKKEIGKCKNDICGKIISGLKMPFLKEHLFTNN
jgi:hypothetical protein